DLVRQVGRGQVRGQEAVRPGHDLDLAEVAAGDVRVKHVRDGLDLRGQLVEGEVAQLRRVAATGQDHRHDGEDRRRHLLDGQLDVGGYLPARGADAVPGELEGLDHVGPGGEINGQVAAAPDGRGADPAHAQHRAGGQLQRARDEQLHADQV